MRINKRAILFFAMAAIFAVAATYTARDLLDVPSAMAAPVPVETTTVVVEPSVPVAEPSEAPSIEQAPEAPPAAAPPPTADEEADRQLTAFRDRTGKLCTRVINKVHRILLKHNLQQECPTKGIQTKKARRWFRELELDEIDRFEMDLLLDQWDVMEQQLVRLEAKIRERQAQSKTAMIVATMPGAGAFSSLALASRIGDIERFPRADSLANYWGLVPGCRNSGDVTDRLGSITKQGSKMARFILGQMVLHVLRRDSAMKAWYARIKKRRGSKIARVAVMRRLATILWHMIKRKQPYVIGGAGDVRKMQELYEMSH